MCHGAGRLAVAGGAGLPAGELVGYYHHYAGPKRMTVWPYNGHEGGQTHQVAEELHFLREAFALPG